MTRQHDLKLRVRQRMQKTGERYVVARSHVLAAFGAAALSPSSKKASVAKSAGYQFEPGICRDTAAAVNALSAACIRLPNGEPISESLLTGLAGGIGFLYITFEYAGMPPLLSVLTRFDTSADQFVFGALRRLVPGIAVFESSSAAKSRAALDAALAEERPALCVVDALLTAHNPPPGLTPGMAPTVVTAVASEGAELSFDAGHGVPLCRTHEEFAKARAGYRKAKNRMCVLDGSAQPADLPTAIDDAIAACLDRYVNAPYKGFASNFGFAGMEKLARLLVDEKDAKGWPRLFAEGRSACLGLKRLYEGLQCEMTGPGAGRAMYAQFLREAAAICGHASYDNSAQAYDRAAEQWSGIAAAIADCGVRAVKSGCDLLDAYCELLDANDANAGTERKSPASLANADTNGEQLDHETALSIFRALADRVRTAIEAERTAFDTLKRARAGRTTRAAGR